MENDSLESFREAPRESSLSAIEVPQGVFLGVPAIHSRIQCLSLPPMLVESRNLFTSSSSEGELYPPMLGGASCFSALPLTP